MILKSLSRRSNSGGQLFSYLLRYSLKEKSLKNKDQATIIYTHNLRSRSPQGWIKEYLVNESYRIYHRKNSVMLFHNIISFSPLSKEHLNDKILKDIAKKFVELRGPNNLYLAVAHKEKAHTHLHLVVSGTSLSGKSSRVSKQKFQHIKIELDKHQEKYPQLVHSLIQHQKNNPRSKEELIQYAKTNRQTIKQILLLSVDNLYNKAASPKDFLKRLKAETYEPYYRNGKLQGIIVDEKKYRLSRLGINEEKLQHLEHQASSMEKHLSELKLIRSGNTRSQSRDINIKENKDISSQSQDSQSQLQDISDIRQRSAEKEIEEQTIERVPTPSEYLTGLNNFEELHVKPAVVSGTRFSKATILT